MLATPPLKEKELPRTKPQRSKPSPIPTPSENFTLTQKHFVWLSLEQREKHWLVTEKNGNPLIASDHPIKALYITVKKLLDISPFATIYYDLTCSQTIRHFEETLREEKKTDSSKDSLYAQVMFLKDAPYRKKRQSKRIMTTAKFLEWCWEKKNPSPTTITASPTLEGKKG